jgi:hypothetical protein
MRSICMSRRSIMLARLAVADLLELPDDTLFIPATTAAIQTPTQSNDPANLARTRAIALVAG